MSATARLCERYLASHPADAARTLEGVAERPLARFLARLPTGSAAPALGRMQPARAAACLARMTPGTGASLVVALPLPQRLGILRRVPGQALERILGGLEGDVGEQTRRLLRFPEDSAAALMAPGTMTVAAHASAGEARRLVRAARDDPGRHLYVLDEEQHLVGVLSLHALLRAPRDEPVRALAETGVPRLPAHLSQRRLLEESHWDEHDSLPLVDDDGVFLGAVDHRGLARARAALAAAPPGDDPVDTVLALGELFWAGLSGVMDGMTDAARGARAREGRRRA